METKFVETSTWGAGWQKSGKWEFHTVGPNEASNFAIGYLRWLRSIVGWMPTGEGLDIGAGAGYLTAAFMKHGINMTASEWSDEGLTLIHKLNPELASRKVDIQSFQDIATYDFIFGRELYPFTRVNAFTEQHDAISRIIDALKPGGVFVLIGSEVSFPHCADWRLLIQVFRRDERLFSVSRRYLEPLISRSKYFLALGKFGYWVAVALLYPLLAYKKKIKKTALIGAIVFRKK